MCDAEKSPGNLALSEANLPSSDELGAFRRITRFLLRYGVETHGIAPVLPEQRTDKRIWQMFLLWFTANFNILAFGTGSAGPAFFGLGLRDSLLILLVVDILTCSVPAYFAVFGPKLGTRGMVHARFSWGLHGAIIPSALNVFSMQGFLILNCIIGGQALAAVSSKLSVTVGIVIISVISLVVTFCGYKCVHWFESFAWIPNVITFPLLLGLAGKELRNASLLENPASIPSASAILSFGSLVASTVISWCTLTPDYGVYHDANARTQTIFLYTYFGFLIPSLSWHMLGAALTSAASNVPTWEAGFENGSNVGGLLAAILSPCKGFGKFMLVLVSISTASACAPSMYSFGTSFMAIAPVFARVPRYVFVLVSEAILIPIAIVGAKRFYETLIDILSVIGYWSTVFAAIVLTEHFLFRKGSFATYNVGDWNRRENLPPGLAAVFSFCAAFGLIVPTMSQTWYTGLIAAAGTGDIGVISGAVVGSMSYAVSRSLEMRWLRSRRSQVKGG